MKKIAIIIAFILALTSGFGVMSVSAATPKISEGTISGTGSLWLRARFGRQGWELGWGNKSGVDYSWENYDLPGTPFWANGSKYTLEWKINKTTGLVTVTVKDPSGTSYTKTSVNVKDPRPAAPAVMQMQLKATGADTSTPPNYNKIEANSLAVCGTDLGSYSMFNGAKQWKITSIDGDQDLIITYEHIPTWYQATNSVAQDTIAVDFTIYRYVEATVKFLDVSGNYKSGGTVKWNDGGTWTTLTETSTGLWKTYTPPSNQEFSLTYQINSQDYTVYKTQNIGSDSVVIFQEKNQVIQVNCSGSATIDVYGVEVYGIPSSSTSGGMTTLYSPIFTGVTENGQVTLTIVPGTVTLNIIEIIPPDSWYGIEHKKDYNLASANPFIINLSYVTIEVQDSEGDPLNGASIYYFGWSPSGYAYGWWQFGMSGYPNMDGKASKCLLPAYHVIDGITYNKNTFKVSYNGLEWTGEYDISQSSSTNIVVKLNTP